MASDFDRLIAKRLRRRDFMRYAGIAAGAGVLASCKKASTTATAASGSPRSPIAQEPGGLKVFDWAGYGGGEYYPKDEKAVFTAPYEKATSDTPTFVLFENDDDGFTKVATGNAPYDVVHPCAYRFKDYVDLGAVQPWDPSLIKNFSQLSPLLEQLGQIDGQQYFIPEDWGYIAPMYNADQVQPAEDSWSLLWDDRYAKRIAWINTLEMLVIAGYYNGVADPWTMTDDELTQQRDFLISKKDLVSFFWDQSYDFWLKFKRGDVWIGYAWPDAYGYASAQGMNAVYMQPKEGRIHWSCGLGLFADSQNYYHAHDYANTWSSVDTASFLENFYYYGHANTSVDLKSLPPGVVKALNLDNLEAALSPHLSHPESWISRRDVYAQYWSEVKAA